MNTRTLAEAIAVVEAALWPDGPRCPRCPDSRRFERMKSRDGRWHRCLSCYTGASATAGSFLHKVRSPLPLVLCLIEARITNPKVYATVLAAEVGLHVTPARNILKLWDTHKGTREGRRLHAALTGAAPEPKPQLLQPGHPMHGLL